MRGAALAYAECPSYLCMALEEGGGSERRDSGSLWSRDRSSAFV
jgi:hypothetical protein